MNAYETQIAKQTAFHAIKRGWSVTFSLENLPLKFIEAIHLLHRKPCAVIVVPHDANDMFCQLNDGSVVKKHFTESQKLRMAVKRHWIALGSPGTWEDFYKTEMDGLTIYEDNKAEQINKAGEAVISNNPSLSSDATSTASPAQIENK